VFSDDATPVNWIILCLVRAWITCVVSYGVVAYFRTDVWLKALVDICEQIFMKKKELL
jgi:hypothetical protein